ncbi:MAG: hypothetical protein JW909_10870 [Planctomycetes bacterium]|nr:hypothetical protein [Planctomycetota bacterium]
MPAKFSCPNTGKILNLPDSVMGKAFKCPACGEAHRAPAAEDPQAAMAPEAVEEREAWGGDETSSEAEAAAPPPRTAGRRRGTRDVRRRGAMREQTFIQKHWWKLGLAIGVPLIVVIALVSNHAGNKQHRARTLEMLAGAEARFDEGNAGKAMEAAALVKRMVIQKPSAFGGGARQEIERRTGLLERLNGQEQQASAIVSGCRSDYDAAKKELGALLEAAGKEGERGKAVEAFIGEQIERVAAIQLEDCRQKVEKCLSRAAGLYESSQIRDAAAEALPATALVDGCSEEIREKLQKEYGEKIRKYSESLDAVNRAEKAEKAAEADGDYQKAEKEIAALAEGAGADGILKSELEFVLYRVQGKVRAAREAESAGQTAAAQFERIGKIIADSSPRIKFDPASVDAARRSFELDVSGRKYGLTLSDDGNTMAVQANGYYFLINARGTTETALLHCGALAQELAAGGAERNNLGNPWIPLAGVPSPPGPGASRTQQNADGTVTIFVNGGSYDVRRQNPTVDATAASQAFEAAARPLAEALERAEGEDAQIRAVVAAVVRAGMGQSRPNDYLSALFCRRVLADGYINRHLPKFAEQNKDLLSAYHEAYRNITKPLVVWESGELQGALDLEGRVMWRFYDPKEDTTTFAEQHPELRDMFLFVHTVFAGRHETRPEKAEPVRVRMVHRIVGEVAAWEAKEGKFSADDELWALGARCVTNEGRVPAHFGSAEWRMPPHAVLLDANGDTKALITEHGRLDIPDFSAVESAAIRNNKQDDFMDRCAKVLATPGELHMFYKYCVVYTLDSPVDNRPGLLGSSRHQGDIHQDYHQFLDRKISGKFIGDCDDIAEVYQTITKKQDRISYVLGVPQHATCGWVERQGDGKYAMYFVDTGPPREFVGDNIPATVERGLRSYETDDTMLFDPNSVEFLFRFAGEATRTRYYLSTRMFEDPEYAVTMIEVQSNWHFHVYLTGIKTMAKMLETDKDPANCFEIASLYGRVREIDKALQWLKEGIDRLPEDDMLSRVNHNLRYADFYMNRRDDDKARESLDRLAEMLKSIPDNPAERQRYMRTRIAAAMMYTMLDRPWKAWEVIKGDIEAMQKNNALPESLGGATIGVYYQMKKLEREGRNSSDAEKAVTEELKKLVETYVGTGLFKNDDSFTGILQKYAHVAVYYAAELGDDKVREELLKVGPYPARHKDHTVRAGNREEDWAWIRLSIGAYDRYVDMDLDPKKDRAEQKPEQAVAMIQGAVRAAQYVTANRIGSLASQEYVLMGMLIQRAAILKDWAQLASTLETVQKSGSARLHHLAAGTLGHASLFITPQDFRNHVMTLYVQYIKPRPHYFELVYAAYDVRSYDNAMIAAEVAKKEFPQYAEMRQEANYLKKLIESRKKEEE